MASFEFGEYESFDFAHFQDCFGSSGSLTLSYEFWEECVSFPEGASWGFDKDCIESVDHFGEL